MKLDPRHLGVDLPATGNGLWYPATDDEMAELVSAFLQGLDDGVIWLLTQIPEALTSAFAPALTPERLRRVLSAPDRPYEVRDLLLRSPAGRRVLARAHAPLLALDAASQVPLGPFFYYLNALLDVLDQSERNDAVRALCRAPDELEWLSQPLRQMGDTLASHLAVVALVADRRLFPFDALAPEDLGDEVAATAVLAPGEVDPGVFGAWIDEEDDGVRLWIVSQMSETVAPHFEADATPAQVALAIASSQDPDGLREVLRRTPRGRAALERARGFFASETATG